MAGYRIKLAAPDLEVKDFEALPEHLLKGIQDPGIALRKFEAVINNKLGSKHSLALNSGTSALHLGLLALGVAEGDEVLCPSFTFAATINAVSYTGATPIIVDSEFDTWNICPKLLQEAITDRIAKGKYPKALLVAHTYGMPAKIEEILAICDQYGISVVEDAAGSLGSTYKGKYLGTFGDVGIISFNYNKIVTTGGGGILLTKSEEVREKAAYLATQAKSKKAYYEHHQIGYNYQMNGLAAELGILQFPSLEEKMIKKRAIYNHYLNQLASFENVVFQKENDVSQSNRWLTTLLVESSDQVQELKDRLHSKGIEVRNLWNPMHRQPVFQHYPNYLNGTSESLFQRGLALPSGTSLTTDELEEVSEYIKSFFPTLTKS